jgi:3-ketosteroid 9alpha-monooxygenase subunit B
VSRDRDAEYFVCGPDPFMEVVEQALLDRGVDREHIRIERFTPTQPTPAPDIHRSGTRITIELNGRQATADHRPGTTVLQMARQLGLSPPSSCEAGDCATCIGRLVAGTATMRANNALTAEEVEAGWILTCQAEPASPDVHVVYGYE